MASEHGENPRPPSSGGGAGAGSEKGSSGGEKGDQLSFVQRLQRHFGPDVDPRIDLQEEDGPQEDRQDGPAGRPESGSSALQEFVKRLSPTLAAGGRFQIKQEVASGGMGTILRVWDGDLRRNLAMKVMHGRGAGSSATEGSGTAPVDPERLGRFLEEAQITGQLDHPGVVPVHDLGIDSKGQCYFTMRFVRGAELKDVLDLYRAGKEGWTRTKVLGVILKVCEAMAYAHSKGVVHRDLKPSNVMVGRFGETYVMDWGLARVLGRRDSHDLRLKPQQPDDASAMSLVRTVRRDQMEENPESSLVTMDGDVIGTPSYMAPEQARGKLDEVGPRSDVYSLGAILYYMLTGQAPYVKPGERVSPHVVLGRVLDAPPTPVEKLQRHEPVELVAICTKAMERDPAQRYASMLEVADDIQAFLENRVVRAYERGSLAEFKKWVVRNKGMAAGLAGMITLALASAGFFAWRREQEFAALERKEKETSTARYEAEENLRRAQDSEQLAKENLELAEERRVEAATQAEIARANEAAAKRSSYAANILAADYSLRTNELAEARERLRATEGDLRGWEWRHLALKASAPLATLSRFTSVEALAFQPGEDRAIVLTGQGYAKIWDLRRNEQVGPDQITASGKAVATALLAFLKNLAMDVNAQGTQVALVGDGPKVQVFDLETGERPPGVGPDGLAGHGEQTTVLAVAFSPNARYLASGDADGEILVRDAQNWEILRRLPGHVAQITGIAWSPASDRIASSSRDGSVRVWDFETGRGIDTLRGHRGPVRAVAWDVLGEHLFSAGEDGAVHMWEADTGRVLRTFQEHQDAVVALDYDPLENRLVTGSSDRTVRVWDVASGTSVVLRGHEAPVVEVAFDPIGERVLSGDADGVTYLWAAEGDLASTVLVQHREQVNALAFSPDGTRLVSAGNDHEVVLWDALTGEPLRRLRDHESFVNSLAWSADGRSFLSGSHDQTAYLWDAETGRVLRRYGPFDRWVVGAGLVPDGSRVIVATGDRKVRVLDAETRTTLRELGGATSSPDALSIGAQGRLVAAVARELLVWDLARDASEPLFAHKGRNSAVAISPDERRIATGGLYGLVQVFDAGTGELLASRQEHSKRVHAITWTPDSRRLATASEEGEIHVREAESGETLLVLREPRGAVTALAFSADGARLATGLRDGTIRVHETSPASERRALRRAAEARTTAARERVDELFAQRFFIADVVAALETDRDLGQELREAALRLAYLRGDDPDPLLARSLAECLEPEQPEAVYSFALERAAQAETLIAGGAQRPNTVVPSSRRRELEALSALVRGIAFYRMKRYSDAADLLGLPVASRDGDGEPEAPRSALAPREEALRLLFLCMTQCQTAEHREAERSWRRAQQNVLNDAELSQSEELAGLLAEAETLVRSSAPPAGS